MSRPKVNPSARKPAENKAAAKIADLRAALGMTREKFAAALKVSRVSVLNWETGNAKPSAETYVRLSSLARDAAPTFALWCLKQAGVSIDDLRRLVPEIEKSFQQFEERQADAARKANVVGIPVLRDALHADDPSQADPEDIEGFLVLDTALVPNRDKTSCLRVPDDLLSPVFNRGDYVLIDASESEKDIEKLSASVSLIAINLKEDYPVPPGVRKGQFLGWVVHRVEHVPMIRAMDALDVEPAIVARASHHDLESTAVGIAFRHRTDPATRWQLQQVGANVGEAMALIDRMAGGQNYATDPNVQILGRVIGCFPAGTKIAARDQEPK